ncbi:MAG: ABC-F family ATP-binding cassette domain-containing protein [Clostridiales Family XIII bacterium]|jgi:ATP-binding cassette subfamily F protein 3|nr:ABC-F family ATP-binding cassette domain-containing protein [Clostridiales Family XIII bacterium]
MTEIAVSNLSKSFGVNTIIEDVSFNVNSGERVGIVGGNGAGKSTLLKILAGLDDDIGGRVFISSGKRVGYLRQEAGGSADDAVGGAASGAAANDGAADGLASVPPGGSASGDAVGGAASRDAAHGGVAGGDAPERGPTVLDVMRRAYEETLASGIAVYESEVRGILRSMAFPDGLMDSPVRRLSGGEKTRLALAELMLKKPDILLLDEPTNHLDLGTLNWLEQKLKSWTGTILLISHDRYFLDQTVNRIFEIERHRLTAYNGNYSAFAEKKRAAREAQERAWQNNVAEIKRQEDMIRRFKERGTEKLAKRAASREKRLSRVERVTRPEGSDRQLKLRPEEKLKSGNDVIAAEGLCKGFETNGMTRTLFRDASLDLKRGERVCMVGANGIGKTTLLKILLGRLQPDGGDVSRGHNVKFGYYDQEQRFLAGDRTVLDEMTSAYRLYSEGEMRNILARFLFTGDMVFQEVSSLSGGERAKLALLKTILSGANTLLLDEPTNHMDILSREAIEDALLSFTGTLFIVSHDRYFLSKVPTRIVELTSEGLVSYPGNYDYFMEKKGASGSGKKYLKDLLRAEARPAGASGKPAGMGAATDGMANSAEPQTEAEARSLSVAEARLQKKKAETERRRREKRRAEAEARIEHLETAIANVQADIGKEEIYTDPAALTSKAKVLEDLKKALDITYERWYKA